MVQVVIVPPSNPVSLTDYRKYTYSYSKQELDPDFLSINFK